MSNFKDCELPDILKYPKGNKPMKNCPFTYKMMDGSNPCQNEMCEGVDWTGPLEKQEVCKGCKTAISNFCKMYSGIDPACICWKDEYKDHAECSAFRSNYEDPNDYNCNIDKFPIEQHPDFSKYIKKKDIPCWNCNLTTT